MTATEALRRAQTTDKVMLTPSDVAPILGCEPYAINIQAHEDPSKLGFPVIITGRRIRIPKGPFLAYIGGGAA